MEKVFSSENGQETFIYNIYAVAGAQKINPSDGWGTALRKVFVKGVLGVFLPFHRLCYVHPERAVALVLVLAVCAFFAWPAVAGLLGAIVASTVALGASAIISSAAGYATMALMAVIGVSVVGNVNAKISKWVNGPPLPDLGVGRVGYRANSSDSDGDDIRNSSSINTSQIEDDEPVLGQRVEDDDDMSQRRYSVDEGNSGIRFFMGRASDTSLGIGSSTPGTGSRSSTINSQGDDDLVHDDDDDPSLRY